MDRLLARLERTFLGKLAVPHLTLLIVGGMAVAFVLGAMRPEFLQALELDLGAVRAGQVWRLFTFLFIPPRMSPIWVIFALYMTYLFGSNLESNWGTFKFNVFYALGALGTVGAAWITGMPQGSFWLNTSLFLAFANVFPTYEIYIFFILPVRVKWLGLLTGGYLAYAALTGDMGMRAAIAVAMVNYFVFFARTLVDLMRGRSAEVRQRARRAGFTQGGATGSRRPPPSDVVKARVCAICGARQDEGADIRVCTCPKCAPKRELCLEHARNH